MLGLARHRQQNYRKQICSSLWFPRIWKSSAVAEHVRSKLIHYWQPGKNFKSLDKKSLEFQATSSDFISNPVNYLSTTYTAPNWILNFIDEGLNSGLLRLCSHCCFEIKDIQASSMLKQHYFKSKDNTENTNVCCCDSNFCIHLRHSWVKGIIAYTQPYISTTFSLRNP